MVKPPPASPANLQPSGLRSRLSSVVGKFGSLGTGPQQASQDGLQPVAEYNRLVSKLEKLTNQNKAIGEELRMAKDRIDQIEKRAASNSTETDETLRGIRATMTRLLKETDRKPP
jgi:hypothetical protein